MSSDIADKQLQHDVMDLGAFQLMPGAARGKMAQTDVQQARYLAQLLHASDTHLQECCGSSVQGNGHFIKHFSGIYTQERKQQ